VACLLRGPGQLGHNFERRSVISEAQPAHSKRSLAISDYAQACQRAKTGIAQHLAQSTRDRGAEIIKIEPREGNAARRIGPFLKDQPVPSARFFGTTTATRKSVPHPRTFGARAAASSTWLYRGWAGSSRSAWCAGSRIAIACFTDAEWRHEAASPRNQLTARAVSL
jgi:hypothetical protein